MTSLQPQSALPGIARRRPLHPWPALIPLDTGPQPKPLVMGRSPDPQQPLALARVRTRWQPSTTGVPRFPIEPANDPVQRLADDDRAGLTLLTLVLCVTVAIALLGFGLQIAQ
jgi:hypothetical protein